MKAKDEGIKVAVYGTDWCGLTRGFRNWLDMTGVQHEYHDLEAEPEAEAQVIAMNGGKRKFPMVVVGDVTMKNPPLQDLNKALNRYGLLRTES